jgi:hypothetical protein
VCNVPAFASPLIRFGQWMNGDGFSDHVHAFIYLGNGAIAEAAPGGARIRPLDGCGYTDIVWSWPAWQPSGKVRQGIVERARWYVGRPGGTPYGWLDYWALGAHRLHLPMPGVRHRIETGHTMICSQLADRCADDAGEHLFDDGRWCGFVTPGDLYQAFTAPGNVSGKAHPGA